MDETGGRKTHQMLLLIKTGCKMGHNQGCSGLPGKQSCVGHDGPHEQDFTVAQ